MESENPSSFFDSIVDQPSSLCSSVNEVSVIEEPNSCSTPNVHLKLLSRHLKRKFSNASDIAFKVNKIDSFSDKSTIIPPDCSNIETSISEKNKSIEETRNNEEDNTIISSKDAEADVTLTSKNLSIIKDKEVDVTLTSNNISVKNQKETEASKIEASMAVSHSKLPPKISSVNDKINNKSSLETSTHMLRCNYENISGLQDAISLGIEDEYLLFSSDKEDDEKNVESYYHLLDSPNLSEDEDSIINKTTVIVNNVPNTSKNLGKSFETTNISNDFCIASNQVESRFVDDIVVNNLNVQSEQKSKNIISRSIALKQYIKNERNSQKKRYPKWLEHARKNCTQSELIKLMQSIYQPSTQFKPNDWFAIEDLSINNYRNALIFSGKSPDILPKNKSSNFYCTELSTGCKRFAMN